MTEEDAATLLELVQLELERLLKRLQADCMPLPIDTCDYYTDVTTRNLAAAEAVWNNLGRSGTVTGLPAMFCGDDAANSYGFIHQDAEGIFRRLKARGQRPGSTAERPACR